MTKFQDQRCWALCFVRQSESSLCETKGGGLNSRFARVLVVFLCVMRKHRLYLGIKERKGGKIFIRNSTPRSSRRKAMKERKYVTPVKKEKKIENHGYMSAKRKGM